MGNETDTRTQNVADICMFRCMRDVTRMDKVSILEKV